MFETALKIKFFGTHQAQKWAIHGFYVLTRLAK